MISDMMRLSIINGSDAIIEDFFMTTDFEALSSNSREPSRTININPIVPIIGNMGSKLGMAILKVMLIWLAINPNNNNKITLGILVLDDVKSKTYDINSNKQSVMIIDIVIDDLAYCFF